MFVRRHVRLIVILAVALVMGMTVQSANAQGTVEGPNSPATVVSSAGPFVKPWTSPGNASASDDVDATATVTAPLQQTDFLDATGFGFSIPTDRVIRRIEVRIEGRANTLITTARVQLLKSGAPVGATMSAFFPNSPGDGVIVLNDQDDLPFSIPLTLWDTLWTPAEINAAGFGVRVDFDAFSGSPVTFEVDHIRVQVYSFPMLPAARNWGLIATAGAMLAFGSIVLLRVRRRALRA